MGNLLRLVLHTGVSRILQGLVATASTGLGHFPAQSLATGEWVKDSGHTQAKG